MIVKIGTEAAQFFLWEYSFRIFGIVSVQCVPPHPVKLSIFNFTDDISYIQNPILWLPRETNNGGIEQYKHFISLTSSVHIPAAPTKIGKQGTTLYNSAMLYKIWSIMYQTFTHVIVHCTLNLCHYLNRNKTFL